MSTRAACCRRGRRRRPLRLPGPSRHPRQLRLLLRLLRPGAVSRRPRRLRPPRRHPHRLLRRRPLPLLLPHQHRLRLPLQRQAAPSPSRPRARYSPPRTLHPWTTPALEREREPAVHGWERRALRPRKPLLRRRWVPPPTPAPAVIGSVRQPCRRLGPRGRTWWARPGVRRSQSAQPATQPPRPRHRGRSGGLGATSHGDRGAHKTLFRLLPPSRSRRARLRPPRRSTPRAVGRGSAAACWRGSRSPPRRSWAHGCAGDVGGVLV